MSRDGICQACKCCEKAAEDCWNCGGDGYSSHDCGEDSCCCLDPHDNVRCDICRGRGYTMVCLGSCDENGKHVRKEREAVRETKGGE